MYQHCIPHQGADMYTAYILYSVTYYIIINMKRTVCLFCFIAVLKHFRAKKHIVTNDSIEMYLVYNIICSKVISIYYTYYICYECDEPCVLFMSSLETKNLIKIAILKQILIILSRFLQSYYKYN